MVPQLLMLFMAVFMFSQDEDLVEKSNSITREEIAAHISFLSHDLLEGRAIGQRGGIIAETYIEAMFQAYGLVPAFGESYRQPLNLLQITPDHSMSLNFKSGEGEKAELSYGDDFVAVCTLQQEQQTFEAELVYMGYGIISDRWDWDDYKDVDVKGKILIMHVNEPRPDLTELFEGKALTYMGRWRYKYEQAARKGALGALLIHSTEDAGYDWTVVYNSWSGNSYFDPGAPDTLPLQSWISGETAEKILSVAGFDLAELRKKAQERNFQPVPLGMKVSYSAQNSYQTILTHNIVGIARGNEPSESANAIVLSAHHDHLGIGNPKNGDNIYNGAIDNGSALATMLSLARFYGENQGVLKSDIVFLACAAEEEGLLGSALFARTSPIPKNRLIANINFELTNVWEETDDLIAIGAEHSQLEELITEVAARHSMTLSPESTPEQGYFFRSDQFSFAQEGVPGVWFDCGEKIRNKPEGTGKKYRDDYRATAYHQPTDEFNPKWPLAGTLQLARIVVELITELDIVGMDLDWKESSPFKR